MGLLGKMEAEVEMTKSNGEETFDIFSGKAHHTSKLCPEIVQKVDLHEGDWETSGSIKAVQCLSVATVNADTVIGDGGGVSLVMAWSFRTLGFILTFLVLLKEEEEPLWFSPKLSKEEKSLNEKDCSEIPSNKSEEDSEIEMLFKEVELCLASTYLHEDDEEGKVETIKEKVSVDEKSRTIKFTGLEGDYLELYNTYKVIFHFVPKGETSMVVKITLEYGKKNDDVPPPQKYIDFLVGFIKGLDTQLTKQ
ncbi:hypothetical protein U1Q18_029672 [Sarracenia purpurea var. burkii]